MMDVNVYQENMFHTKMLLKDFELDNYLFGTSRRDITFEEARDIESRLRKEMLEIFTPAIWIKPSLCMPKAS
ncbi:hypothetical protein HSBAA_49600 [Vreelandella sulfidaeris]|uniref:Adenosylmethionine decarboxylase n=1 Tax=Vreelandella sulfidaeris TaxID=115553 RepID=A0A455UL31_9GAMM|nr:hypothetical protein HSBAA_49600 [Halomonas sulfidaeris]